VKVVCKNKTVNYTVTKVHGQGIPLQTTKTKTKQRMTYLTGMQDSWDWIFCFVRTLGWQNRTSCFVWRNSLVTKTKQHTTEKNQSCLEKLVIKKTLPIYCNRSIKIECFISCIIIIVINQWQCCHCHHIIMYAYQQRSVINNWYPKWLMKCFDANGGINLVRLLQYWQSKCKQFLQGLQDKRFKVLCAASAK